MDEIPLDFETLPSAEMVRRAEAFRASMACGLFIAAVHNMGLCTLPYTPAPMGFLSNILERPPNETPCILFPVGHPAPEVRVPRIERKALSQIATWK